MNSNSIDSQLISLQSDPDPFGTLSALRAKGLEYFNAVAEAAVNLDSTNPGIWRYLALHFIRADRYDLAAIASAKHEHTSPSNLNARLRSFRIAILANDSILASQALYRMKELATPFQLSCSNFLFRVRFDSQSSSFAREKNDLILLSCSEFCSALLNEMKGGGYRSVNENGLLVEQLSGSLTSFDNLRRFACLTQGLGTTTQVTLLGNGGSMRTAGLGTKIDNEQFVVRINFPKLTDLEEHVGSRTDMVFFTEAYLHNAQNLTALRSLREHYLDVPGVAIDASRTTSIEDMQAFTELDAKLALMPVGLRRVISALSYEFATTGLCALVFLTMLCRKKVRTYGFDFYSPAQPTHFFSKNSSEAFIGHETSFERFLIEEVFSQFLLDHDL